MEKRGDAKKEKGKDGIVIVALFTLLLLISLTPNVSAFKWCEWVPFVSCGNEQGKIISFNDKWVKDYSTDNDADIFLEDPYEVNTTVCLMVKNETKLEPKNVYAIKKSKEWMIKNKKLGKLTEYVKEKEKDNIKKSKTVKDGKSKTFKDGKSKTFKDGKSKTFKDGKSKTFEDGKGKIAKNEKSKKLKHKLSRIKEELNLSSSTIEPVKITRNNKEYYAYCYQTKGEKYLKFGNHSTVVTYANGHIEIKLDNGTVVQDITLYENSEQCLVDCYAYGQSVIYKNNTKLFEGVDFKDKNNNTISTSEGEVYIKNITLVNVSEPVYMKNCSVREYNVTLDNGTISTLQEEYNCSIYHVCTNETVYDEVLNKDVPKCEPVIDYYYNYTKRKEKWLKYNFENLTDGEYEWKIKLDKRPDKNVDWAFAVEGFSSDEIRQYWAWWNSSWTKKRVISNLTGEYPTFNVSYDSDMKPDFADVRFLDSNETVELNYTIRKKVNSSWAFITVDTNNESSIYMYYGNNATGLGTTENASKTFIKPTAMYYLDEVTGNVIDVIASHDGTNNGADRGLKGVINNSFDFENSESDYVNMNDFYVTNGNITISMWVKLETISVNRWFLGKDDNSLGREFAFGIATNNKLNFQPAGAAPSNNGNTALSSGTWYHVAIVYDSNSKNGQYYVNGVSDGSFTSTGTITDKSAPLNLGRRSYSGAEGYTDGLIDEVVIYDKVLTSTEVNELYSILEVNATFGPEQDKDPAPVVILNSPVNDTLFNTSSITFNCTGYDHQNITNMTLYIDGKINQSNTTVLNNTNYIFNVNLSEGEHNWTCEATDYGGQKTKENEYFFTIDLYQPEINITYPYEGFIVTENNQTINVNWTFNETNPDECWLLFSEPVLINVDSFETGYDGWNATGTMNVERTTTWSTDGSYGLNAYNDPSTDGDYIYKTVDTNNVDHIYIDQKVNILSIKYSYSGNSVSGYLTTQNNTLINLAAYDEVSNLTIHSEKTFPGATPANYTIDNVRYYGYKLYVNCSDNQTTFNYPTSNPDNLTITLYIKDAENKTGEDNVTIYKNTEKPFINITQPRDGDVITTATYYVNWTINQSLKYDVCKVEYGNSTTLNNKTVNCSTLNTTLSFPSEQNYQLIRIYANDTLGNMNATEQINVTKSFELPFVNITEPIGTQDGIFYPGDELNLSYEMTATPGLDECWYTYNGTNTTITCGNETTTFKPKYGDENVTVCAKDNLGNINCDSQDWGYQAVLIYNDTNKNVFTEGELMNFTALIYSTTGFTPYLIINGTSQLASIIDVNNDFYNVSYTQYAPEITLDNETITYQWDIQILATSYKSDKYEIVINNIKIGDCSTYDNLLLNFTGVFDESENERIVVPDENVTFGANLQIFTADHSTQIESYDYETSEFHHKAFCTNLNFSLDYKIDAIVDYHGNDTYLAKRIWYMDNGVLPLNGRNLTQRTKQNVSLYLLNPNALAESPQSVVFRYYDTNNQLVYDAIVHVYRNNIGDNDTNEEIGRAKTNNKGDSVIDLSIDSEVYRETVTIDGEVVFDTGNYKVLTCTEYVNTYCIIDLGLGRSGGEELDTGWYEIDGGRYQTTVDRSARTLTVKFNLSEQDSTNITYVYVYKSYYNGTMEEIASNSKVGKDGEVQVVIPMTGGGNYSQLKDVYLYKIVKNQTTIAWGQFSLEQRAYEYFGKTFSLFLAMMIVMTLGMLAASGGTLQVVYVIVGLIASAVLGLVNFDFQGVPYGLLTYLIIAGGIIIWKLASKMK